ncbi:MAG TPA: hypothetical protein VNS58_25520 [Puia sp.]|nr:hypothetical protein [Puia sp.]
MENDKFIIDLILKQWESKIKETTRLFESLGESSAMDPVAQGRNRVIYLLGHLVAVHDRLSNKLKEMDTKSWLEKHHYVSEADFLLRPERNKLNVLLSRLSHLFHHYGQLVLVRRF